MWNQWNNHDGRKNNRIEGFKNRMTNYCGASDPNFDKVSFRIAEALELSQYSLCFQIAP